MMNPMRNNNDEAIARACRKIAEHYYGARGLWVSDAFAWINETLFFGELPQPLIVIGLTAHGGCLGLTSATSKLPPVIMLHPSVWGGTEKPDPWNIDPELLGPRYALDVLIHESIHVSVEYRLGGAHGESSHNNPEWISEINRIAPLIGLDGMQAAMSKPKRVKGKVQRVCDGNISLDAASKFPREVRKLRGELAYYRDPSPLPFERNA